MRRMRTATSTALLAFLALASVTPALAGGGLHAGDVVMTVEGDSPAHIVTNAIAPGGEVTPQRVFEAPMIDFFGFGFTADPGFDSRSGTYPPFTVVQLNILDALRVWENGSFDTLAATPMNIAFGAFTTTSPLTPHTHVPGPSFGVNGIGQLHVHADHFFPNSTAPGVYLLAFELDFTAPGIDASEPFYFVYGWMASPEDVAAATAWVQQNLLGAGPNCPADLTGDGVVNAADLSQLLGSWGPIEPGDPADLTADGVVNAADLSNMLGSWGNCT